MTRLMEEELNGDDLPTLFDAIRKVKNLILAQLFLTPHGKRFAQEKAEELALLPGFTLYAAATKALINVCVMF